ncbi:alkene reductase [Aureivirga marina]|uniref:alkene reductase n=1 Tax=Aureivirga marina TaxID=1182451 RepID=UPI0018CA054C|nr:alkene reductase [Aureivirga marina]
MKSDILFKPFEFNGFKVKNRIAMAPMTRARSKKRDIITDLAPLYYAQRASAGLLISEGIPVSKEARGYAMTPGIYTREQIEGWKKVTEAVHKENGKIFAQLWHVGRRSAKSITGTTPLAPSAIKNPDKVYGPLAEGGFGLIETDFPKAMTIEDINRTKQDFLQAAKNAMEAGFDGVEIHGAHGYLFDQFMRKDANKRTDIYGGNVENRIRFVLEIVKLLVEEIGADKVAIRISPFVSEIENYDEEMPETALYLMKELNAFQLAYLHLSENIGNFREVSDSYRIEMKKIYKNPIMVCGNYTKETATEILEKGWADMVSFGRLFITNPDLVERFKNNFPLEIDSSESAMTYYGGGAEGYTDYKKYGE